MQKTIQQSPDCNFSFEHYREILQLLKELGYKDSFFSEEPSQNGKRVYLRHDIDIALEKAPLFSAVEKDCGVHATYFIRLGAPFYNPFEAASLRIISELVDAGHQIGLHAERGVEAESDIVKQLNVLREYFPVQSVVSFHKPPEEIQKKTFEQIRTTYEKPFFVTSKYISDSKGSWREGCVCKLLEESPPPDLQILAHPVWWGEREDDVTGRLRKWLKEKGEYLDEALASEISTYKKP